MSVKVTGPDEHGYAYIYINEATSVRRTISSLANIDVDENGVIVGVELLGIPDNLTFGN